MDKRDPEWLQQITRFISRRAPARCAEFLDSRIDVAEKLKRLGFSGPLRLNAHRFVARIINSTQYAEWAAMLFPSRAPQLTPVAIQLLPAHERLFIVKFCLGAVQTTHGAHAVSNLVSYTKDPLWYVTRGAVPDGKRTWKLWRLVTQHRHLLSIKKTDHWFIIRALLATCPTPRLPPSGDTLCSRADELAIKIVLNPPTASLATTAVALARKIDPAKTTIANVLPTGAHAHLIFDVINPTTQPQTQPTFTHTGKVTELNVDFVLKTILLDNDNKVLLSTPHDLFWNQASFQSFANRVALFSTVIRGSTGVFRVTEGREGDAYGFCTSALVGLFDLHRNAFDAIRAFFELSKRVRIGDKAGLLWPMLWSTNHNNTQQTRCFALLIGPRTRSGGVFNPRMPLFNQRETNKMFAWYHDTVAAFATNPLAKIVTHLANTGEVYTEDIKRHIQLTHRFFVELHAEHPDIGPDRGVYGQLRVFPATVSRAIQAAQDVTVKNYLRQWFMPKFHSMTTAQLRHRLHICLKISLRAFILCLRRTSQPCPGAESVVHFPPELLSIVFSLCM